MRAGLFVAFGGLGLALVTHVHDLSAVPAKVLTREAQAPPKVDFARDVQPIFRQHCVECHGPSQQMRGLDLSTAHSTPRCYPTPDADVKAP